MTHWVVVPFRGPEGSKSRLADTMSEDGRQALSRAMFQHVLSTAVTVAGASRVLVVTPSPVAARLASAARVCVLRERASDLNGALDEARTWLRQRGATTMAIVAADLPLVTPADIAQLEMAARPGRMVIALDRGRTGTNALAVPTTADFTFKFGRDSGLLHARHAAVRGLEIRSLRQSGLAADVDVASDLELLRRPAALSTLPSLSSHAFRGLR